MEWLQLVASGVLGALAGGFASVFAASRIGQRAELGRVQESSRHRLLATVRGFRAQVNMQRGNAGFNSSMDLDYLSADTARDFAEEVERDIVHFDPKARARMRTHLVRLVGPVDAAIAAKVAPLSRADRPTQWRAAMYRQEATGLSTEQVKDNGLLGQARDAKLVGLGVDDVLGELERLESTVQANRPRRRLSPVKRMAIER